MTEIINLNKARKAKTKQAKKLQAAQNRITHGISTKVRKIDQARENKTERDWSANLLQRSEENKKVDENQ